MFKDLGQQILVKWQLWKLLVLIYPLILIYGYMNLFQMANFAEVSHIDGNQMIKSHLSYSLSESMSNYTEGYLKQLRTVEHDQISDHIVKVLQKLGLQTYVQENEEQNIVARFRAKRSPNFECFVISFEYDDNPDQLKLRNAAFIFSLIRTFLSEEINYLSRDIIFVGIKSKYKQYGQGIQSFLKEYINPQGISLMPRSGTLRQALHVNLDDYFDSVAVKVFGLNGRVPDRDYFLNFNMLIEKSGIKFTYSENDYTYLKQAEQFIQQQLKSLWEILQLNQIYQLPKNFINIFPFYGHLIDALQGDIHEAHPYFLQYGVHALTIRGFNKNQKKDQINLSKTLSLVFEGSIRGYMAMDEFLHAGSTMYIPVGRATTITIQIYVLPLALLLAAYVIPNLKNFLRRWHFNLEKEDKGRLAEGYAKVVLKEILLVLLGFALCFCHQLTQFGQQYTTIEYYQLYWSIFGIIVIIYFLLNLATKKYYFKQIILERTQAVLEFQQFFIAVNFGLGLIYASIINLPIGYCMAVILGPWMLTFRPIRFEPQFKIQNLIPYLINLLFLFLIYQTCNLIGFDQIWNYVTQIIKNYKEVEVELYYYLNVIIVPFLLRLIGILMF